VIGVMIRNKQVEDKKRIKIAFLGNSGVGKTQLINKLQGQNFEQHYEPTEGMSYKLDQKNPESAFFEFSGNNRYQTLLEKNPIIQKADIIIICVDKSDDSLKEAEKYINKIPKNQSGPQVLIAITKEDILLSEKEDILLSEQEKAIRTSLEHDEIELIKTSALTETGIEKLREKITDKIAEKAGKIKDRKFLDHFKLHFLDHLKKTNLENSLSTIFDTLKSSINTTTGENSSEKADVNLTKKSLLPADNVMDYMRPTLNEAADVLLDKKRTRLNDTVIDAIGIQNYAKLVSGVIVDGKVKAIPGQAKDFAEKEAAAARDILASVLTNYCLNNELLTSSKKDDFSFIAKYFSLQMMLDEPKNNSIPSQDVEKKVGDFLSIVNTAYEELKKQYKNKYTTTQFEEKFKKNPLCQKLLDLRNMLSNSIASVNSPISESTKRDFLLAKYQDAVTQFVKNVKEDDLKVEPLKVRSIFERLKEAITRFSFSLLLDTNEEKSEKQRFKKQSKLKNELISMKKNPELGVQNIEEFTPSESATPVCQNAQEKQLSDEKNKEKAYLEKHINKNPEAKIFEGENKYFFRYRSTQHPDEWRIR
jgi:GTPase SAR1 family protein